MEGSAQMRTCGNVSVTYARKRKVRPLDDDLVADVPIAKRRLLLPCGGGVVFISSCFRCRMDNNFVLLTEIGSMLQMWKN